MTRPPQPLTIAAAIDARYLVPLRVMLTSLVRHLPAGSRAVLHLLHTDLPAATLAPLHQILETHPVQPTPAQLASLPRSRRFPREAAFPLLLPDVLPPGLDRVLFLDADLFIRADITPLWHTPLDDAIVAAATDQAIQTCGARRGVKHHAIRGIPSSAPYFNCGVLLIDLPRWRGHDVSRLARQYLVDTGDAVDFYHQEALNAVLHHHWQPLDQPWNCLASCPSSDARIVHFGGRVKPWRTRAAGPHGDAYQATLTGLGERAQGSMRDAALGVYDRCLRRFAFPLERWLWNRRLL